MWEAMADLLRERGYPILLQRRVTRIVHDRRGVIAVETANQDGMQAFPGSHFISSMPIRDLVRSWIRRLPKWSVRRPSVYAIAVF